MIKYKTVYKTTAGRDAVLKAYCFSLKKQSKV